jgi:hypothetical protein
MASFLLIILIITLSVVALITLYTLFSLRNESLTKPEFVIIWSITSIVVGGIGFFLTAAIILGTIAAVYGGTAFYFAIKEKEVDSIYKIVALLGLFVGVIDVIVATLGLLGWLPGS